MTNDPWMGPWTGTVPISPTDYWHTASSCGDNRSDPAAKPEPTFELIHRAKNRPPPAKRKAKRRRRAALAKHHKRCMALAAASATVFPKRPPKPRD